MQPISKWPLADRANVELLFTDIDDTMTSDGALPAIAYCAVEQLQEVGIGVVPVTGRPAGWCDLIARFWPVAGVIGENGALYFRYDRATKKMRRTYWQDAETRTANRKKLDTLRDAFTMQVPGCAIASDQAYRETDLAIDFCEDVPRLPIAAARAIQALFEQAGACAKISSIHVNGWFGDFDKLKMTKRFLNDHYGDDSGYLDGRAAFSGDSPNDEPMFHAFKNSVGVANVVDFLDDMNHHPAWIAGAKGGKGFAEIAAALISARAD
jgi:hypothetical protein